jgi:hypothetical protein
MTYILPERHSTPGNFLHMLMEERAVHVLAAML